MEFVSSNHRHLSPLEAEPVRCLANRPNKSFSLTSAPTLVLQRIDAQFRHVEEVAPSFRHAGT